MLELMRNLNESITLGGLFGLDPAVDLDPAVEVTVVAVEGERVRLGISAPKSVPVHRTEVWNQRQEQSGKQEQFEKQGGPASNL